MLFFPVFVGSHSTQNCLFNNYLFFIVAWKNKISFFFSPLQIHQCQDEVSEPVPVCWWCLRVACSIHSRPCLNALTTLKKKEKISVTRSDHITPYIQTEFFVYLFNENRCNSRTRILTTLDSLQRIHPVLFELCQVSQMTAYLCKVRILVIEFQCELHILVIRNFSLHQLLHHSHKFVWRFGRHGREWRRWRQQLLRGWKVRRGGGGLLVARRRSAIAKLLGRFHAAENGRPARVGRRAGQVDKRCFVAQRFLGC